MLQRSHYYDLNWISCGSLFSIVEWLVGSLTWNRWKSKNISYFLDKRTIQLVSGASMIFSAPKIQWVQIFGRLNLNVSAGSSDDGLRETIELLLVGCITSRWTSLIEYMVSVCYDCKNISEQYHEVCNLLYGRSTAPISKQEAVSSKESNILEYLSGLLGTQLHQLWKMSPSLVAVAIPSRSPLFRLYLSEIQIQFRGDFSTMRCCGCAHDMKEHNDCELAERIWCLYIFHVCGSHLFVWSCDGAWKYQVWPVGTFDVRVDLIPLICFLESSLSRAFNWNRSQIQQMSTSNFSETIHSKSFVSLDWHYITRGKSSIFSPNWDLWDLGIVLKKSWIDYLIIMFINFHQWDCDISLMMPASGNWYLKASSVCFLANCILFLVLFRFISYELAIKQHTDQGG